MFNVASFLILILGRGGQSFSFDKILPLSYEVTGGQLCILTLAHRLHFVSGPKRFLMLQNPRLRLHEGGRDGTFLPAH